MVFVGHAAVIDHGVAAISSFAHRQRQPEENHLRQWLGEAGFLTWDTPRETPFEGEGDMLFDPARDLLWAAHGARTCRYSHRHVADAWHTRVESLHLVDPRFYHLDTRFAPLSGGEVGLFSRRFRRSIPRPYRSDRRTSPAHPGQRAPGHTLCLQPHQRRKGSCPARGAQLHRSRSWRPRLPRHGDTPERVPPGRRRSQKPGAPSQRPIRDSRGPVSV